LSERERVTGPQKRVLQSMKTGKPCRHELPGNMGESKRAKGIREGMKENKEKLNRRRKRGGLGGY